MIRFILLSSLLLSLPSYAVMKRTLLIAYMSEAHLFCMGGQNEYNMADLVDIAEKNRYQKSAEGDSIPNDKNIQKIFSSMNHDAYWFGKDYKEINGVNPCNEFVKVKTRLLAEAINAHDFIEMNPDFFK